jgi:hypothetical protein
MRVVVEFDPGLEGAPEWVRSRRAKDINFIIYLLHAGVSYPADSWNDFGVPVLGQWLAALSGLSGGTSRTAELWFLDGPFKLRAEISHDRRAVSLKDERGRVSWELPFVELVEAVVCASSDACRLLRGLGVDERILAPLEVGAARIGGAVRD